MNRISLRARLHRRAGDALFVERELRARAHGLVDAVQLHGVAEAGEDQHAAAGQPVGEAGAAVLTYWRRRSDTSGGVSGTFSSRSAPRSMRCGARLRRGCDSKRRQRRRGQQDDAHGVPHALLAPQRVAARARHRQADRDSRGSDEAEHRGGERAEAGDRDQRVNAGERLGRNLLAQVVADEDEAAERGHHQQDRGDGHRLRLRRAGQEGGVEQDEQGRWRRTGRAGWPRPRAAARRRTHGKSCRFRTLRPEPAARSNRPAWLSSRACAGRTLRLALDFVKFFLSKVPIAPSAVRSRRTPMLDVFGQRRQSLLNLLLERKDGLTIDQMAAALGITRTAVREHVGALERERLIAAGALAGSTGGRPGGSMR